MNLRLTSGSLSLGSIAWLTVLAGAFCFAEDRQANTAKMAKVTGVVVGTDGHGIPGIRVDALQNLSRPQTRKVPNRQERRIAHTDSQGRFSFIVAAEEQVLVYCRPPEEWRVFVPSRWVNPEDSEVLRFRAQKYTGNETDFSPLKREVVIQGKVIDLSHRPVRAAVIASVSHRDDQYATESSEDGDYELRIDVVAEWSPSLQTLVALTVDATNLQMGVRKAVTFNERWEYDVPLHLESYARISGKVIDESGRPVAQIPILQRNHTSRQHWKFNEVAQTDADGVFWINNLIPGCYYSFAALSPKHGTSLDNVVYWSRHGPQLPPIAVLPRDQSVEGTVVSNKGKPIPEAKVHAEACLGANIESTADEYGRFRISGLVSGQVLVRGRRADTNAIGRALHGEVTCQAAEKDVRLVLNPMGCVW